MRRKDRPKPGKVADWLVRIKTKNPEHPCIPNFLHFGPPYVSEPCNPVTTAFAEDFQAHFGTVVSLSIMQPAFH